MVKVSKKNITVARVLRRGHKNSSGKSPVCIQVTYNRQQRRYPVKLDGETLYMSAQEYQSLSAPKVPKEFRDVISKITKVHALAIDARDRITRDGKVFSWDRFEKEFVHQESKKGFLQLFADYLNDLRSEGRIGSYLAYKNAYEAFKSFRAERDLKPEEITPELLKAFEKYLREPHGEKKKKTCGKTTIAMYARALKIIFNHAVGKNPALLENYPFAKKRGDRNKYRMPKQSHTHKGEALSLEQLQKFIAIPTEPGSLEREAKLIWLFSFYCQGMNMKDISLLKYKDIQGQAIRYLRAKTKDTEEQPEFMEIPLSDRIAEIVREIGNESKGPEDYVFTIIPTGLASAVKRRKGEKTIAERIAEIIKQKTKMVNARVKEICVGNNLPACTTYWARHSYACMLKDNNVSIDVIKEMLGHSDSRTTQSYLKRFGIDDRRKLNEGIESKLAS